MTAVLQEPEVREVGEESDESGRWVCEEEVKHQLRECWRRGAGKEQTERGAD